MVLIFYGLLFSIWPAGNHDSGLGFSDIGIRVLDEIGEQMKGSRRFDPGTDYSDVFADGVKCQFRPVHAGQYEEYLCFSIWFYETKDFPAWQCFWPDEDGFYPWQEECSQDVRQLQPLLFKSQDESRQAR
jgi:hypothetical protein